MYDDILSGDDARTLDVLVILEDTILELELGATGDALLDLVAELRAPYLSEIESGGKVDEDA